MQVRITNGMLMSLVMTLIYSKALGLTQGIMAREVGGDIWLATLVSLLQALVLIAITVWTIKRSREKNIIQHAELIWGRLAGKLVGLLIFLFFIGAFTSILITFVYHLMDYFLPDMPIIIFIIMAATVILFGVFHGLEVLARTSFLGVLCMIMFNMLMILGTYQQLDIREILPVVQTSLADIVFASRHMDTDWAISSMTVAMILPAVADHREWGKAATSGIILGGLIVILWPLLEVTVITPEMTAQYIVSCMQMARSAEIGVFFHRYEMIMVALFIIPMYVQMMMCLYCACLAISQVLPMRSMRVAYIPVMLLLGVFGYWVVIDHMRAMYLLETYWPMIALPIAFGIPILLYLTGFLLRKKWQAPPKEIG